MDAVTQGLQAEIVKGNTAAAQFAAVAPRYLRKKEPSMVVGRPGATAAEGLEDGGNTVILPLPDGCPKLYCCQNETGGATSMLAEEY